MLDEAKVNFKEGLQDPALAFQAGRLMAYTDTLNDPEIQINLISKSKNL